MTALHILANRGSWDIVSKILTKGVNVNTANNVSLNLQNII